MTMIRITKKVINMIVLIVLVVLSLTVSCSNFNTKNNEVITSNDKPYKMTIHEYFMHELITRFNHAQFEKKISSLYETTFGASADSRSGEIDEYELIKFFADNITDFIDPSLFDEIIKDASFFTK